MERINFRIQLNEGFKEEYEKRHNPVWEELESQFLNNGVIEYNIFMDDDTNEIFGVITVESKQHWEEIGKSDVVARWRKHMDTIFAKNADGSVKMTRMREVFHIMKKNS